MSLYVQNSTADLVFVAYAYGYPGCDGSNWAKKGWYALAPGVTANIRSGYTGNAKYFFYAENAGGTSVWAGPFTTHLPSRAFDWCWNTGSTDSRILGLRKVEVSWSSVDHTIRLV